MKIASCFEMGINRRRLNPFLVVLVLLTTILGLEKSWAVPRNLLPTMGLRTTFRTETEPLTTEKVWKFDPEELNPHRRRWILSRQVILKDLQVHPIEGDRFSVTLKEVEAYTSSHLRGAGPWFQSIQDFRCEKEPQAWFSTREGAQIAAREASTFWEEVLGQEKDKLATLLSRVVEVTPQAAKDRAQQVFTSWYQSVSSEWRIKAAFRAKSVEWRSYWEQAIREGVCKVSQTPKKRDLPPWETLMEPPSTQEISRLPLVRAPARRWNGLFSVRLNIRVGSRNLNGLFLIDSGAGMSIVSPIWLKNQGILPTLVEVPNAPLRRVTWSGGSALARKVQFESVVMSDYLLPLQDFLLFETDFFEPPENIGTCCDGILGTDFLRNFVVEFHSAPPAEVRIWAKEGYHLAEGTPWIEAAISPTGEVVSSCKAGIFGRNSGEGGAEGTALEGLRWDTGSEVALDVHLPWISSVKKLGSSLDLRCVSGILAHNVPVTFPDRSTADLFSSRFPAVNIGIPVLERGSFFMDLPHGRLWFPKESLEKPILENQSGLTLEYDYLDGERVLRVTRVQKSGPVKTLLDAGLNTGMLITQVDSKPSEDIDLWEVNRRLAGAYGDTVTLQWKTRQGLKIAPLKIR